MCFGELGETSDCTEKYRKGQCPLWFQTNRSGSYREEVAGIRLLAKTKTSSWWKMRKLDKSLKGFCFLNTYEAKSLKLLTNCWIKGVGEIIFDK